MLVDDFINFLRCPDCKSDVERLNFNLHCTNCGREYHIYGKICIDMLPSQKFIRSGKTEIEKRSIEIYNKLFDEPFIQKQEPKPWGLEAPKGYLSKLNKHKYIVDKLLPSKIEKFIDVSAGSGRFTFEVSPRADICVLCDISVDSVLYLTKKVKEKNRKNILIIRADYTSQPFKEGTFDVCVCNDTLIYGPEHEKKLLSSIYEIVGKDGVSILDFSNKYHRGFYHKPYTFGYVIVDMIRMLEATGFKIKKIVPLYYELSRDLEERRILSKLIKLILPPTRYVFRVAI